MKHFTTEEWIDFANEAIAGSKRQDMERHLGEGCSRCEKAVSLWQKVRQTAKSAVQSQPPENAVHLAKAGFSSAWLGAKPARVTGLVEVLFDSFLQTAVEGARSGHLGAGSGTRQILYRADPYQVDLQIEAKPGGNKLVVTGQLLDLRNPDAPGRNVPVIISNLRGHVVHAVTNEFGEFSEEIRASSDLELKLLGENDKAVIISLRDALGKLPADTVN